MPAARHLLSHTRALGAGGWLREGMAVLGGSAMVKAWLLVLFALLVVAPGKWARRRITRADIDTPKPLCSRGVWISRESRCPAQG